MGARFIILIPVRTTPAYPEKSLGGANRIENLLPRDGRPQKLVLLARWCILRLRLRLRLLDLGSGRCAHRVRLQFSGRRCIGGARRPMAVHEYSEDGEGNDEEDPGRQAMVNWCSRRDSGEPREAEREG